MTQTLPALFISHGPPTLPLERLAARDFLTGLAASLPARPSAILAVSAHWETRDHAVTGAVRQAALYDFYGFPPELYDMTYAPQGDPALVQRVTGLLSEAGIPAGVDGDRNLDHGVWTPLSLIYPDADIPVVQLSLRAGGDARHHAGLGAALAPLRDEGVLILCSGNVTHNLSEWQRLMRAGITQTPEWVTSFQEWVADRVGAGDEAALCGFADHPEGRHNHPTDEHFLPFFVAMGAGGAGTGRRLHDSVCYTVLAMDAYAFG
ncbi:MAG: dioxygenase [Alphaproteobacteria bacterium]|nr:dioxygenase [Alphaproteobacteria bacterium]MBO6863704.1 dioxygenase [Alphaproteobacteria bacterium]